MPKGKKGSDAFEEAFELACSLIMRLQSWYQSTLNWLNVANITGDPLLVEQFKIPTGYALQ